MHKDMYADFHVHTHLSPCGKPQATAAAMVAAAETKGIVALGFADHFTPKRIPACSFYDGQQLPIVEALKREVENVSHSNVELLFGVEADYTIAGDACLDDAILAQTTHIIGAASHYHLPGAPIPESETPEGKASLQIAMALGLLALRGVSVWAHPFECSRMRPLAPILAAIPADTLTALIATAIEREVAIEINGGASLQAEYRSAIQPFMQQAREMGARFTLTADAHHPDDFVRLDEALDWAYAMGFTDKDFMTAAELLETQQHKLMR